MRGISKLHPDLQPLAYLIQNDCKKIGIVIGFLDTERTKEEQNAIPSANTKVKFPYSYHNWCLALDFCIIKNGQIVWKSDCDTNADHKADYIQVGEIAKKYGFIYGGDWTSFKDWGHIESHKYGIVKQLIAKYGTPENFKKSWLKQKPIQEVKKVAEEIKQILRSCGLIVEHLADGEPIESQINWLNQNFGIYKKNGGK